MLLARTSRSSFARLQGLGQDDVTDTASALVSATGLDVTTREDRLAMAERLRRRRNWELGSVLVSGVAGVASLVLFATGRYMAGYALAAGSAIVGGVITVLRISSDYDEQVAALEETRR